MFAAAYYRSSTPIQKNSISTQRRMAHNTAIDRLILIDEEYVDESVSARKNGIADRPALSRLLEDIVSGKITTLFVYKRDRLAREVYQWLEIYNILKKSDIKVIFTSDDEPKLRYNPSAEIQEIVWGWIVEYEGAEITKRIDTTRLAQFQSGEYPGQLPFGYTYNKEKKKHYREEEELKIVEDIYTSFLQGNTAKEIAEKLNSKGDLRRGSAWSTQQIRSVLTNPTYMGDRRLVTDKGSFSGPYSHLAVITQDQWEEAQILLDKQTRIRDPQDKNVKPDFLLDGLIFCQECLSPLQTRPSKVTEGYYSCPEHKNIKLTKNTLEEEVISKAKEFFSNLLSTESVQFFERYKNRSKKNLAALIERKESHIKQANNRLLNQTEQWLKAYSELEKKEIQDRICCYYDSLMTVENEKQSILLELEQLEEIFQQSTSGLLESLFSDQINNFSSQTLQGLLANIVHKIWVDQHFLHIEFKHPFLSVKEAVLL